MNTSGREKGVFVNHIGFLCNGRKKVVVDDCLCDTFEIQDMNRVIKENLGSYENWETVFKSRLTRKSFPMGTFQGGFCVGPRGTLEDHATIDLDGRAEWNSTEYWLTPLSNTLMALAILLPKNIRKENKIGIIGENKH